MSEMELRPQYKFKRKIKVSVSKMYECVRNYE